MYRYRTERSIGSGNQGLLSGPVWTSSGKNGGALSFDGVNDLVTIADSATLDLTTGLTLEAWVNPTALDGWKAVIAKETARTGRRIRSRRTTTSIAPRTSALSPS